MTKRGTKSSAGRPASTAPLKGAIQDGNTTDNLALRMVLERLDSMDRQRVLEVRATQAALTATTETMKRLQEEMAREKHETAQAIELLHQQIKKIVESRPDDPVARQAIGVKLMRDAKENIARKRAEFLEALKTMPTGTFKNDTGKTIRYIINGVDFIIKPGLNEMPMTVVDAWEHRQREKEHYYRMESLLQSRPNANEVQRMRGQHPFWDEELGKVG